MIIESYSKTCYVIFYMFSFKLCMIIYFRDFEDKKIMHNLKGVCVYSNGTVYVVLGRVIMHIIPLVFILGSFYIIYSIKGYVSGLPPSSNPYMLKMHEYRLKLIPQALSSYSAVLCIYRVEQK